MVQPGLCPLTVPSQDDHDQYRLVKKALRSYIPVKISAEYSREFPFVRRSIETWLEAFSIYGFGYASYEVPKLLKALDTVLVSINSYLCSGLSWVDYFKWKNASFFSFVMDQTLPPPKLLTKDKGHYLLSGPFYTFIRMLKRVDHLESFALTILQSKKGMPRPSKEMVVKAERKSELVMTSEKPETVFNFKPLKDSTNFYTEVITESPEPIRFSRVSIEKEIRRTVREIFREGKFGVDVMTRPVIPSSSANYIYNCKDHGSYPAVDAVLRASGFCDLKFKVKDTVFSGFDDGSYGFDRCVNEIEEKDREHTGPGLHVDTQDFQIAYNKFYWNCFNQAFDEKPIVKVVGLSEPLKVRVISKGPPLTYFVLKPIQKFMLSTIQKFWNFELTGTPITEQLMNKRFRDYIGQYVQSGDYTAATDELQSWCSEAALDELIDVWKDQSGSQLFGLRELMLRSLTHHLYEMPDGTLLPQKRGQLMGSITSFVFLCILNFSLIRMAHEHAHGRRLSIRETPTWINGDDCLTFYTNKNYPVLWRGLGDVMGLSESIGKTYDSLRFCSINSMFFSLVNSSWKYIPYVNFGLLFAMKKSSVGDDGNHDPIEYSELYSQLLSLAPRYLKKVLSQRFVYLHSKEMSAKYKNICWALPTWLNGLGVGEPNQDDLYQAARTRLFYSSTGTKPPTVQSDGEWKTHQVLLDLCKDIHPLIVERNFNDYEGSDTYAQVYACLFWFNLFSVGYQELVQKKKKDVFRRSRKEMYKIAKELQGFKEKPHRSMMRHELRYTKIASVLPIIRV
nr:MAG: RNA-dependent RNA polymerase [Narnaviridae sp.]